MKNREIFFSPPNPTLAGFFVFDVCRVCSYLTLKYGYKHLFIQEMQSPFSAS